MLYSVGFIIFFFLLFQIPNRIYFLNSLNQKLTQSPKLTINLLKLLPVNFTFSTNKFIQWIKRKRNGRMYTINNLSMIISIVYKYISNVKLWKDRIVFLIAYTWLDKNWICIIIYELVWNLTCPTKNNLAFQNDEIVIRSYSFEFQLYNVVCEIWNSCFIIWV